MKKYIVHEGYIKSKNDGQMHHMTEGQLIELYNVPISQCLSSKDTRGIKDLDSYMHLYPRNDGNYTVK